MLCTIFASILLFFGSHVCEPVVGANSTISNLPELTSLDGLDVFATVDTSEATTKKLKWNTATSAIKTILDAVYSPIFSTSAGFFGLISDETGNAGGVVRATSPTLTTPTLNAPTLDVAGTDATGDIYYNSGSGLLTRLPIGSSNEFLRVSGGLPDWDNTALLTNPQTSTSTFSWSNINTNPLVANTLAYAFPSSRGASSTVLTEDGSGNLKFYLPSHTVLYKSTASSTVSTTATSTALTVAIPANTLGANGTLRITSFPVALAGSNISKWQMQIGNGSASTTILQTGGADPNQRKGSKIETHIYNQNSTSFQVITNDIKFVNTPNQSETRTFTSYSTESAIDTTQKMYIAFQAGENNAGAETGYGSILVELIRTP